MSVTQLPIRQNLDFDVERSGGEGIFLKILVAGVELRYPMTLPQARAIRTQLDDQIAMLAVDPEDDGA
jgi:hypothetical protein